MVIGYGKGFPAFGSDIWQIRSTMNPSGSDVQTLQICLRGWDGRAATKVIVLETRPSLVFDGAVHPFDLPVGAEVVRFSVYLQTGFRSQDGQKPCQRSQH